MLEHALPVILGVGIVSALLLFVASNLESKHFILQLLILVFVVNVMLLIPKAGVDAQTVCESVVNTTTVTGNTTSYAYTDFCYVRPEGTARSFLQLTQRMYYLMLAYAFVFLFVVAITALYNTTQRRRK